MNKFLFLGGIMMDIQKVTDSSFGKYGRVLQGYSICRILKEMEHTPLPKEVI